MLVALGIILAQQACGSSIPGLRFGPTANLDQGTLSSLVNGLVSTQAGLYVGRVLKDPDLVRMLPDIDIKLAFSLTMTLCADCAWWKH